MAPSVSRSLSKLRTPIMIAAAVGAVAALTLGVATADAATPQAPHTPAAPAAARVALVAVPGAVPQHVVWGGTPIAIGPINPSVVGTGVTTAAGR